ncbi:O-antigen ligase [Saliphagus sp. LR7]|uniref:O-antigen ligase family protein n=1 Tax=Saliphagus sp. LR7 TaxID=2282654 RepID=UPI000DF7A243|nr:O-antigen ligase family protein [Saliphagus sp. LR7]
MKRWRVDDVSGRWGPTALAALLLGCILSLSVLAREVGGRLFSLAGFGVFAALLSVGALQYRDPRTVLALIRERSHPLIVGPLLVLWAVFTLHALRAPSLQTALHTAAYIAFSGAAMLVVPVVVSRRAAFSVIAAVGAGLMAIGLPSVVVGDIAINGVTVTNTIGVTQTFFGVDLRPPASIFTGRNYLRMVCVFGVVCSAGLLEDGGWRQPWLWVALALNLFGVVATQGRSPLLALLAVTLLLLAYEIGGRRALAGATILGSLAAVVGFGVALGHLPGPTEVLQTRLGTRVDDWTAGYHAFLERPILGWGILDGHAAAEAHFLPEDFTGVHSSYVRPFVLGGIVAGLSYLALLGGALWNAFKTVDTGPLHVTAFALVVMVFVFSVFDGATVLGANITSVLWAVAVGYSQPA